MLHLVELVIKFKIKLCSKMDFNFDDVTKNAKIDPKINFPKFFKN